MKIAFAGRVSLDSLAEVGTWNRPLPEAKAGFPFGSELVRCLVARGHSVAVVTEHNVAKVEKYLCKTAVGALEVWLVPRRSRSRWTLLTLFYKEMCGIRNAIREIGPDVVFAQWTYHNAYAGSTSGYPCLVVAHDSPWRVMWTMRTVVFLIKAMYSQFFVLPKIKNLSVVSPHIGNDFRKMGYRGHMSLIGNGYSSGTVSPSLKSDVAAKVVMVTQWGRLKNSKVMLKAWEILHRRHENWKLVVCGDYMDEHGAEPWMRKAGLGDLIDGGAVELRGFVGQAKIRDELRTADLFVSPSLEESFGMVFLEAMAQGVPCVGGEKSGAVPWVLGCEGVSDENSETRGGVVCDVTTPAELADCVEKVMVDAEFRRQLSEGGRRRVREVFDIKKVIGMYEKELARVASL